MQLTTILIVEDDPIVRMFTADVMSDAGFPVVEAANADQALDVLHKMPSIKVVVTDIDMPGSLDGLELAHRIKAQWPERAVVVVSGGIPEGRSLPPDVSFEQKPVDPDALVAVLQRAFAYSKSSDGAT